MPELRVHRGPFGLSTLEEAYQSVVYGYEEPDGLRCSQKTRDRIVERCHYQARGITGTVWFNNAAIVVDETLPDNRVRFTNSKYPDDGQPHGVVFGGLRPREQQLTYENMNIEVEFTDA